MGTYNCRWFFWPDAGATGTAAMVDLTDAGIGLVIVMIGVEDAAEKHGPGAASPDDGGQG